jgi:triacylglycerol lipase
MPSVLSLLDLLPNGGGDGKAFECLTIESMRKFNAETPDDPGVRYFSWGATYEPGLIDTWKWPHSVVLEHEGENDGLVSVASSKWVRAAPLSGSRSVLIFSRASTSARLPASRT